MNITPSNITEWLNETCPENLQKLFDAAYACKVAHVGNTVYFRGIIEFSNVCRKNCFYCGIRRDNMAVHRFMMSEREILECAQIAYDLDYGSIVLQGGELQDEEYIAFIERVIVKIKNIADGALGITLSLGEQTKETFERWYRVGAHRYLLRIETSNKTLYQTLHPEDHSFDTRIQALRDLREVGYQVGTGVMIGLPEQTAGDLTSDIQFFRDMDIDMIGMGPYIPHDQTPLVVSGDFDSNRQLQLALKMIALTRLYLKDVNIASTTALQVLDSKGREYGLQAGANIIMPNITPTQYREYYQLYRDKPCLDENAGMCRSCLEQRIQSIGETIGYNQWGDSPHFNTASAVS